MINLIPTIEALFNPSNIAMLLILLLLWIGFRETSYRAVKSSPGKAAILLLITLGVVILLTSNQLLGFALILLGALALIIGKTEHKRRNKEDTK